MSGRTTIVDPCKEVNGLEVTIPKLKQAGMLSFEAQEVHSWNIIVLLILLYCLPALTHFPLETGRGVG
jgi:hypothetical protein